MGCRATPDQAGRDDEGGRVMKTEEEILLRIKKMKNTMDELHSHSVPSPHYRGVYDGLKWVIE